ncbi:MAG: T9SS type A sorting domain-containing protein [Candidatus Eisenbacteria bacterium]|nr:T9SS type A sorting domain-containing protein [Candidatus Latescibacterota bacterium]MBD3301423.1 T9SS type A sorting domain-containing protein [Candidatus Eisenbacteria bacterium]
MIRTFAALLFGCLAGGIAGGAPLDRYEEIRLFVAPGERLDAVLRHPEVELMGLGDGDVRLLSRPAVTDSLIAAGWPVEILHADLEAYYAGRTKAAADLGPWHDYDETVAELEALHTAFPEITAAPVVIGRSHEDRAIWMLKISDAPERDEEEPEVLIDGLHHAREIMSVELCLAFARHLCEGYGADSAATFLVDHREIYLVPIVNPDGFAYNERIRPGGGGMWRKNRRPNPGGCVGVDNNRNYPYRWGEEGSSGNPCDLTYRGPSPASEPETAAMIRFMEERRIVTHDSVHSVLGAILIPWCYTIAPTPDDAALRRLTAARTAASGYFYGSCPEILYTVSGGAIDWAYGEQIAKPKGFSSSTEIGGTGFWPAFAERDGLIAENLPSLLRLAEAAGPSLTAGDPSIRNEAGGTTVRPGEAARMTAPLRNASVVAPARGAWMLLRCDDPYVTLREAREELPDLPAGALYENLVDPFRFALDPACPPRRPIPFTLEAGAEGAPVLRFPFPVIAGGAPVIARNDFERPEDAWLLDESHTARTGAFTRVVPQQTPFQPGEDGTGPEGNYAWITGQNVDEGTDDVDGGTAATRSPDFDLTAYEAVRLELRYFHGQRDGGDDPGGDGFILDVSTDGGNTWTDLVEIGDQATRPDWRTLSVDLAEVCDLTDRVRFRVRVSDGPGENDIVEGGIDAFALYDVGTRESPPPAPEILAPADGAVGVAGWSRLVAAAVADPEGEPVTYGFRIWSDAEQTRPVAMADGLRAQNGTAAWNPPDRLAPGIYFARAFAADPYARGYFGPPIRFTVTDSSTWLRDEERGEPPLEAGPSPSGGSVRIGFRVTPGEPAALAVYDAAGRRIRSFPDATAGAGWKEVVWDGRDAEGRRAASGVYFVRLSSAGEVRTVRIVRLR